MRACRTKHDVCANAVASSHSHPHTRPSSVVSRHMKHVLPFASSAHSLTATATASYREYLRTAVQALILLLSRVQNADNKRQIEYTLCMVLTHQLDWSLDDLELDSTERQIVDRVLADLPAPDFEIELNDRLRTVIIT